MHFSGKKKKYLAWHSTLPRRLARVSQVMKPDKKQNKERRSKEKYVSFIYSDVPPYCWENMEKVYNLFTWTFQILPSEGYCLLL